MGNTTKSGYGSSTGNTEASNCNSSNSESSALALVESILKDDHSAVQRLIHAKRVQGDPLLQPPPIVLAALHGDLNMVKLLVFNGADVDEGILKPISRRGNSVSWELMEGKCALHFGAWRESCDIVGFLLEAGADPNIADANGVTPLMHASEGADDRASVTHMLLEGGASPWGRCHKGCLALHVAARHGGTNAARALVSEAPNALFYRTWQEETPLFLAAYEGRWRTASYLLSVAQLYGKGFSSRSTKECPLMAAVVQACLRGRSEDDLQPRQRGPSQNYRKVIDVLLDSGRGVFQRKDLVSSSVRCAAILGGRADILEQLLDVDGEERRTLWARSSFRCRSMLHYAAGFARLPCVDVLLRAGADEKAVDGQLRQPNDLLGSLTIDSEAALSPGISDFSKANKDPATISAIDRMLERGPAYRARSWAYPAFGEARIAAPDQNWAACSEETPEKNVSPLHVRIFRRQGSTRLPTKSFAAAVNRFCRKD